MDARIDNLRWLDATGSEPIESLRMFLNWLNFQREDYLTGDADYGVNVPTVAELLAAYRAAWEDDVEVIEHSRKACRILHIPDAYTTG